MNTKKILLSHGSGGGLTHRLIGELFLKKFSNSILNKLDDSAELPLKKGRIVFTTDSYVVNPIFFPGGDIGKLAVCGTVNDISVKGAVPYCISVAFIIEEGYEYDKLEKITDSIAKWAKIAGVRVVTGDTKVVERGKCDGIYVNTSGIGIMKQGVNISASNAKHGDTVILSGNIAEHGIAVMNARNNFGFSGNIKSDCKPLNKIIAGCLKATKNIHVMRDPTRGGIATTLNEIVNQSNIGMRIYEDRIPLRNNIKSACSILGIDPLYVANEGIFIAILPEKEAEKVIRVLKKHEPASAIIGFVDKQVEGLVMETSIGGKRKILMLESELLPRIC